MTHYSLDLGEFGVETLPPLSEVAHPSPAPEYGPLSRMLYFRLDLVRRIEELAKMYPRDTLPLVPTLEGVRRMTDQQRQELERLIFDWKPAVAADPPPVILPHPSLVTSEDPDPGAVPDLNHAREVPAA